MFVSLNICIVLSSDLLSYLSINCVLGVEYLVFVCFLCFLFCYFLLSKKKAKIVNSTAY